jgi:hypothetical protein
MTQEAANDAAPPHRKLEDSAAGCRSLASDDRDRAEQSDSDRMRFRLACSAEAWTNRAELLDRLEANRVKLKSESARAGDAPEAQENPDG